jgi:hypothetical protein
VSNLDNPEKDEAVSGRISRVVWLIPALFALSSCGFTGNLRGNPGFASFGIPSMLPEADRQFAISLGPIPLRLATMVSRPILDDDEDWISDALSDVRAVRVYVYEVDGEADRVIDHMNATRGRLLVEGWDQLAAIRDDGGLVTALVRHEQPETVRGVVVMFEEDEELVLVNVIGKIKPETFGSLMEGLDIEIPMMEIEAPDAERIRI